jgi:hypothetical protein
MLEKQAWLAVQKALQHQKTRISVNATWKKIHSELEIGVLSGRYLQLSSDDRKHLRTWFKKESGVDPLTSNITGDRLTVAARVRDEKWATRGVFADLIKVCSREGIIPMLHKDAVTPPGTLLEVDPHEIDASRLTSVTLIENGMAIRAWHQYPLPANLNNTLAVYRGHDSSAATVLQWLKSLPGEVKKIGFFDFDPAGFGMAVDTQMDALIIPGCLSKGLSKELIKGKNNKLSEFTKQRAKRPNLEEQLPEGWKEAWQWMENNQAAITQERLLVLEWPLELVFSFQSMQCYDSNTQ